MIIMICMNNIGPYTDIVVNPLTFENTDSEFDIVKLPDFFNETNVRDGSYIQIVIMYTSEVLRFNP